MQKLFADVVLRLALPGSLQFSVPEGLRDLIVPGQRVRVPLRKGSDVGYVVSLSDRPKVGGIRPVAALLEREPLLPGDLLELLLWVAEHSLSPPGLVFRSALPRAIHLEKTRRATAREKTVVTYLLQAVPEEVPRLARELEGRAPLQARLLTLAAEGPLSSAGLPSSAAPALRSLVAKGHLRKERRALRRGIVMPPERECPLPELTVEQEGVLRRILPSLSKKTPASFLLHGVTGSGKSEIYSRALLALPPHRQGIVLVPEVSLTSHLIRHFRERLRVPLGVWHHQLSEGEKHDLWKAMRRGEIRAVIGARSAVFAPLPDLGLVVVDEEHDSSYKQGEAPSYHAREVALKRGTLTGATVILGSATPSIESYHRAEGGDHTLLELPRRFGGHPLPEVQIVDLKEEPPVLPPDRPRGKGRPLLSPALHTAAERTLRDGNQVLFFLNRRGFAPYTHCSECGWSFKCPNCQVSLVFHSQDQSLLCHYCAFRAVPPDTCPSCRGTNLRLSGTGTQKLEEEIQALFPGRTVSRLDRDAASRKGAGGRVVSDFAAGRTDILVGTQMVAKGFHFPRLSLVGVLAPDTTLNLPDFRAAERAFQVVTQVAGRAGREGIPGKVLIETYQPEHYSLQTAARHDFAAFYRCELEFRRELDYPPFCDLILLRTDGADEGSLDEATDRLAGEVRELLAVEESAGRCRVLGPVPAPLRKIRNRYRAQILIKSRPLESAAGPLRRRAGELAASLQRLRVSLAVDVNPVNLM